MKLIKISEDFYINPFYVQCVYELKNSDKEWMDGVYVGWNYGVSEAPSIEMVSTGAHRSDYSLEETVSIINEVLNSK